jgi:hypothetical protein
MVISFSENVAWLDQCIYSYSQVYTADADPATAFYTGSYPLFKSPLIPGHEVAGVVVSRDL